MVVRTLPIVAAFDLHGNEDEEFYSAGPTGRSSPSTSPHYDSLVPGESVRPFYLRRIMLGEYDPVRVTGKVPVVTPTVASSGRAAPGDGHHGPGPPLGGAVPGVFVNVFLGFPWSDVPDIGTTVHGDDQWGSGAGGGGCQRVAALIWRVKKRA